MGISVKPMGTVKKLIDKNVNKQAKEAAELKKKKDKKPSAGDAQE